MRFLLDTTFVIDYLRDDPAAVSRFLLIFDAGDDPIVNEIVVCEAATGAPAHPDPSLLTMLEPIEFVQPGPEAALLAGQWRASARTRGMTLGLADALIASSAVTNDATILTRNVRDFSMTPARIATY